MGDIKALPNLPLVAASKAPIEYIVPPMPAPTAAPPGPKTEPTAAPPPIAVTGF